MKTNKYYVKLVFSSVLVSFLLGFIFAKNYESDNDLELEYSQKNQLILLWMMDAFEFLDENQDSEVILKEDLMCLILKNRNELISLYERFDKEIEDKSEQTRQMLEIHKFAIQKTNDYLLIRSAQGDEKENACFKASSLMGLVLPTKSRHPNYAAKAVIRSNSAGAT